MTRALVEQRVREWLEEIANDVDGEVQRLAKQRERRVVQLDNVSTLDRKIADLTDRMGRITVRWSSGDLPEAAYAASIAQLDADLAALKARRRRAAPVPRVEVDPQRIAADLAVDWDELSVIGRRNMLRALIHEVRIVKPSRPGTGVWRDRVVITSTWDAPIG